MDTQVKKDCACDDNMLHALLWPRFLAVSSSLYSSPSVLYILHVSLCGNVWKVFAGQTGYSINFFGAWSWSRLQPNSMVPDIVHNNDRLGGQFR